jgi:hypothetical protein
LLSFYLPDVVIVHPLLKRRPPKPVGVLTGDDARGSARTGPEEHER